MPETHTYPRTPKIPHTASASNDPTHMYPHILLPQMTLPYPHVPPHPQNPPGKDVEAPFMALATTFHRNYEEKVGAFQDACRNY